MLEMLSKLLAFLNRVLDSRQFHVGLFRRTRLNRLRFADEWMGYSAGALLLQGSPNSSQNS